MSIVLIILCAVLAAAVIALLIERNKTNRQIQALTAYLLLVQDHNEVPKITDSAEGELRILQSEIYKIANMLELQFDAEKEKNQFLKNMLEDVSHQIKTPLTAITVMSDNLRSAKLSGDERMRCLQAIRRETDHISALVHDLLVSAQIDARVLPVSLETCALRDCVLPVTGRLQALAEIKEIDIQTDIPAEITLEADAKWLMEAFMNIIKNCIEHTAEGGMIEIKASASNLYCDLIIKDNGEGIKEEDLPHIFERFYQASSHSGSTGIGLYLAKQIIDLHHGRIQVASTPGQGTSFSIRFWQDDAG